MNDYKLWAGGGVAVAIGAIAVAIIFTREIAPETEIIAPAILEVAPVIIKVDQVNCVIAEEPTLTYYSATDTVRVTIECDSDLIFNYMPAEEQQNEPKASQETGEGNYAEN